MKKLTFIYASAAALLFAGCASDDLTPGAGVTAEGTSGAIGFNFNVPNQVRGTLSGKDAADKLKNEFVVYGTKHVSADEDGAATNDAVVFNNYKVRYKENSANSTESNTHNWEYNGLLPYGTDTVSTSPATSVTGNQTVKYWDYSAANGYTFTAFSAYQELKDGHVTVTKTTEDAATADKSKYKKGYTVKLTKDANLDNIFYSDRVEVPKASYGQPVVLTFRNFGTRVRVGFYETVPGYSVKIDKFYYDADASSVVETYKAMEDESTNAFAAALHYVAKDPGTSSDNNNITVTYNASGTTVNQPTLTNTTCTYTNTLTLGGKINLADAIATSSSAPTWDSADGAYTTVYPNEANVNPMLIRCDYTLTSTDGSNEKIQVKNARVVVPAEYLKWKPNFAYTYIFKISDKTNGTTGKDPENPDNPGGSTDDDPEGLHPITFDAVVVDATTGNQETVTGITTNSVTTYANGSKVETNDEYKSGEPIYVVDQKTTGDHAVITPDAIGTTDGKAQVYKLGKAATEGEVYAQLTGAKMGINMEAVAGASIETSVPLNDGTSLSLKAVKFTPTVDAPTYFAYVYADKAYKEPTYESVATATSSYEDTVTYYFKTDGADGVYYTASGISDKNFDEYKSKLYKMTDGGTAGVYDIKVIKVTKL